MEQSEDRSGQQNDEQADQRSDYPLENINTGSLGVNSRVDFGNLISSRFTTWGEILTFREEGSVSPYLQKGWEPTEGAHLPSISSR